METPAIHNTSVVVIGAGQAGLSAAHHLKERGIDFVIFDANPVAGGAWQHRWESLRIETVNGIFELPKFPVPAQDPKEPSRTAVPRYFAAFESAEALDVQRPVRVTRVDSAENGELLVRTDHGQWKAKAVINATGTWNNPVLPNYPGAETFRGQQLHTRDYVSLDEFVDKRVAIVGGGISAVQQLEEISRVATTFWYTRREPVFRDGDFRPEVEGREIIRKVTADVESGNPTGSVVSYTGQIWTSYARAAKERGALNRRAMFTAIEPDGVREADGSSTELDAILWATGFKADLAHLDPLHLRNERGGIEMRNTQVLKDPRVHLIGFGPSQSTVGANRAGRDAVIALSKYL